MPLSVHPKYLRRYKDVIGLLVKYGRADIVRDAGMERLLGEDIDASPLDVSKVCAKAEELASDLERLGPTFVKLGQLLSTRSDLLPRAYLNALSRLQDDVEPFPFQEAERIITEDIGAKPSQLFAQIDPTPIAAASLGQVHVAKLRDGRDVVVKVQRPDIHQLVTNDLEALEGMARFVDAHTSIGRRHQFGAIVAELKKSLVAELDYGAEAHNLSVLGDNLKSFRRIVVPCPIMDFSRRRVLTMQRIHGHKVTELSPVVLIEIDRAGLAEELSRAYLTQILVDGFFHADPHPGNVLLDEQKRLALIDVGMVGHVPPKLQESLMKLLLAISEGRGDDAARVALDMSDRSVEVDEDAFRRCASEFVMRYRTTNPEEVSAGGVLMEVYGLAVTNGVRLPSEFTMIGKALLNLDIVTRTLDPKFDPNASVRRHATELLNRRMRQQITLGTLLNVVLESGEFAQRLPERLNRLFEHVSNNEFSVHVDAIDEAQLIRGLQKIANRIAMGLVMAALIVGAALIMQVDTSFRIFGYPGLAILLFVGAVSGGVMLMVNVLRSDR
jgi:ubiquinone biosynthesis protein